MTPSRRRTTLLVASTLVVAGWLAGCDNDAATGSPATPPAPTGSVAPPAPPTSSGPGRTLDLTPPGESAHPTVNAPVRPNSG